MHQTHMINNLICYNLYISFDDYNITYILFENCRLYLDRKNLKK